VTIKLWLVGKNIDRMLS